MIDLIEVNLLPAEYRVRKRAVRLEGWYVWPALVVIVVGLSLLFWYGVQKNRIQERQNTLARLDSEIKINAPIEREIKQLSDEKKVIVNKIMAIERISVNRAKWVRLLEVFCRYLPEYTWLVSMKETEGAPPKLTLQGKTRTFSEVATYMADLRQSIYVTAVELTRIEEMSEKESIYGFEIVCTIDPNAGLTTVEESAGEGV